MLIKIDTGARVSFKKGVQKELNGTFKLREMSTIELDVLHFRRVAYLGFIPNLYWAKDGRKLGIT